MEEKKIILSLFDYTGNWSRPYALNGYEVIQQDIKLGHCIFEHTIPWLNQFRVDGMTVHGILAACPCTEFASSGARWWESKKNKPAHFEGKEPYLENVLEEAEMMVACTLLAVEWMQPKWWVIENPVGRIQKIVPEIGDPLMSFQPCDFGDPYTKKTMLYGDFNTNLRKRPVDPILGSKMHKLSSNNKAGRSETPMGFAWEFFRANP
jgi:hypothetical protein